MEDKIKLVCKTSVIRIETKFGFVGLTRGQRASFDKRVLDNEDVKKALAIGQLMEVKEIVRIDAPKPAPVKSEPNFVISDSKPVSEDSENKELHRKKKA